jgi:integrase
MPTIQPKQLTDSWAEKVPLPKQSDKPNQVGYLCTLERGLAVQLIVSYGGSRTWRALIYDDHGRQQSVKLGRFDKGMTTKQAREQAYAYKKDPHKFSEEKQIGTFKQVADNWMKRHVKEKGLLSEREVQRVIDKILLPAWQHKKFATIRRGQINDLLDDVAEKSGRSMADHVLDVISPICSWFQSRNESYTSPVVKGMRRHHYQARERFLDDNEIRAVWAASDNVILQYGALIKIALLTMQRREKIMTMKWTDIKDGVWTIPRADREKRVPGSFKLPQMALDVLATLPRIEGNDYVFAVDSNRHFNSFGQRKAELDALLPKDMREWRIHDLRRTARSLMARAGVPEKISEECMGHKKRGIIGVYNHYKYSDEMSAAFDMLANLIALILDPATDDKIVSLRRA